jgi:hypothetical protein
MRADGLPVETFAVVAEEDRPLDPFADGQVDSSGGARRERDGDDLAALAQHDEGAVAAFDAEGFDVAPSASETRRPLIASREMSAWSRAEASSAATRSAPTSLRSRPVACDS